MSNSEFETIGTDTLDHVTGGIAPALVWGGAAALGAAAAYFSGGVNVAVTRGNNNNVAVGNRVGGNLTVGNGNGK